MRLITLFAILFIIACSKNDETLIHSNEKDHWLISYDDVTNKPANYNRITPINYPTYINARDVSGVNDNEIVFALKENNIVKVYLLKSMYNIEIVNDSVGDINYSFTYCPLTGSGICFDLTNTGIEKLGISGLLYNDNLMPFDPSSNSIFSQMLEIGVYGKYKGVKLDQLMMLRTNWGFIRKYYPNSLVMKNNLGPNDGSSNTGFTNIFFGVIDKFAIRLYDINANIGLPKIIDNLVFQSLDYNMQISFDFYNDVYYELDENEYPFILKDSKGNHIDVFGYVNDESNRLIWQKSYNAKKWAFYDFYQDVTLD